MPAPPPARVEDKKDHIEVTETIYFNTNRATIRPDSNGVLDEIAQFVVAHPELAKIRIEGHTDSVGSARANRKLSTARATSVREYLIAKGVDAERLVAVGLGPDAPIADNTTEEGRAKNRRVSFIVVDRADETNVGAL